MWKLRFFESPQPSSRGPEQDPAQTLKLQRLLERRSREAERAHYNRNVVVTFCGPAQVKSPVTSEKRKRDEASEDDDFSGSCSTLQLEYEPPWHSYPPLSSCTPVSSTTAGCCPSYEDATAEISDQSQVIKSWLRDLRWPTPIDVDVLPSTPSSEELDSPSRTCSPGISDWEGTEAELECWSNTESDSDIHTLWEPISRPLRRSKEVRDLATNSLGAS